MTKKKGSGIFYLGVILLTVSFVGTFLIGDTAANCTYEISDLESYTKCIENAGSLLNITSLMYGLGLIFALIGIYTEVANVLESRAPSHQRKSRPPIQKHPNASSRLIKNKNNPEFDFACTACNKEFKEFWNKCPSCGGFVNKK